MSMRKFYYDLHIHSCLSPCGDDDSTPANIAGMAAVSELDIVALTDHNTVKNCPAFFEAAEKLGIIPIAGMELTTSEDIHVVCLFRTLSDALRFDAEIEGHRILIENRTDIFGNQLIADADDNIIGIEKYLLSWATDISVDDVPSIVERFDGVCYPAHIDRMANGIIAVLGTLPHTPCFTAVEFHDKDKIEDYSALYNLKGKTKIVSSDAHFLHDIADRDNYFELEEEACDSQGIISCLFKLLKGEAT